MIRTGLDNLVTVQRETKADKKERDSVVSCCAVAIILIWCDPRLRPYQIAAPPIARSHF